MLIITDGVSAAPQPNPKVAAEEAATLAKEEDQIAIIHIHIS